jgi:macrolide-specific efflux system membrane fusion protein
MKLKKSYIIAAFVLILVVGGYYYYKKKQSSSPQTKYVTATAEYGVLTSSISASGNVVVDQSSNIDPTITGTVSDLAVNVGDKVKKGQFLFNIVNDDLSVSVAKAQASYEQALSSLESAKASKKQAKVDLKEANSKNRAALKQKLEAAIASVESAQQSVISAQADLTDQKSKAAERRVVSPIDGTVNAVNIKNGDDLSKLSSGSSRQVPIIIGDLGTMKAQVQVNEIDIANVSIGQKTILKFEALDGLETSGKVEKIDSLGAIMQGVVNYNVIIGFDSLDKRIKPGMSVSASIITDVKQDVLIVPSSAVKNDGNGDYVEVLENGSPLRKAVKIGVANDTSTEIISGVNVGENVITQTISSSNSSSSSKSSSKSGSSGGLRLPGLGGGGGRPD